MDNISLPKVHHQTAGIMSWSKDSQYICTRNDSTPTVSWVWDMNLLELAAILVQKDPIRAAAWDPTCTRLVLCSGTSQLYMWTPSGAYCNSIEMRHVTLSLMVYDHLDIKTQRNYGQTSWGASDSFYRIVRGLTKYLVMRKLISYDHYYYYKSLLIYHGFTLE
ncbi:transducin/WD40 repeat-like superfamily protein [Artemisia annua]|uniref:Transducin/WD40 repeat-like superfamily protein n=1 Tax=Artemisia annua TaxID=35608 RepID=A0A2U1Q3G5_ARTAN|nr:transducin/WD40 repeat-like superfamily protein [Artemisia annua]